ncbi:polysaccharide deacetylase [Paenisporosarcina indica]|uniref:polysaccharide deacetylase n=1 Tax=Paenisporosarcina indica TaxID=650093 RepID=UPI001FEB2196|nr:polysaccharide deacetylase [Paenisporosarcina indica]
MNHFFLCILIITTTIFSLPTQSKAATDSQRNIALHDRTLSFQEDEVRLVNSQMIVPLEKMARYLYADIVKTADQILVTKNNTSISYHYRTKETKVNGITEIANPVIVIDDVLFMPIRFLGESTGFKVDYLTNILTARLYTDTYPHLSHSEFIKKVTKEKQPIQKPSPPSDQPTVYLTFDDGPNRYTSDNLRILKEYNVKATFFFVGSQINHFKSLTSQTFQDGHYLGLHSMTHNRNKLYVSSKAFLGEMRTEAELIKNLTGHTSVLVRAPYGSSPYVTPAMRDALKSGGYKLWDWDVDTVDWKINDAEYQEIINNVKKGVEKARLAKDQHIVILLHDRSQTTKALPAIIEWLQKSGYSIQPYNPNQHVTQNFGNHSGI